MILILDLNLVIKKQEHSFYWSTILWVEIHSMSYLDWELFVSKTIKKLFNKCIYQKLISMEISDHKQLETTSDLFELHKKWYWYWADIQLVYIEWDHHIISLLPHVSNWKRMHWHYDEWCQYFCSRCCKIGDEHFYSLETAVSDGFVFLHFNSYLSQKDYHYHMILRVLMEVVRYFLWGIDLVMD